MQDSTSQAHAFEGEDAAANLAASPFQLASKVIPAEQFNSFDYAEPSIEGFDGFDKVWNVLAPVVGRCIIIYSELETALEQNLHELINDRSDQLGLLTSRQMTYIQKAFLYIDLLRTRSVQAATYARDVSMLKKHLCRAAEIRNIIAHAKWPSVTSDGYVFSSVEAIDAAQGMPDLKYYKLNKEQLELAFNYLCAVGTMPHYIQQEYIEQ